MAVFRAWDDIDLRTLNLGGIYRNAFDSFFDPDPFTVQGVTYEGGLVLESDEAPTETLEFYGNGLTIVEGEPGFSAGRVHGFYRWWLDDADGEWYFDIAFAGFDIAARDLTDAMATLGRADDKVLIAQMLSGDDHVTLWRGADWFAGKAGHDMLFGGGGADTLFGGVGRDVLVGGMGNDLLQGGAGADRIAGDAGNDSIAGGAGRDVLTGGEGADVFSLWSGAGREVVTDFADGVDLVQFLNGPTGFADLTVTQVGAAVHIAHDGETVVLRGMDASQISAEDFLFG